MRSGRFSNRWAGSEYAYRVNAGCVRPAYVVRTLLADVGLSLFCATPAILDGSSHILHATATTRSLAAARNRAPEMIAVAVPNTSGSRNPIRSATFSTRHVVPFVAIARGIEFDTCLGRRTPLRGRHEQRLGVPADGSSRIGRRTIRVVECAGSDIVGRTGAI